MAPDLKEILQSNRPNLGSSSINTYTSTLRTLHRKLFGETDENTPLDLTKFNSDIKTVIDHLRDVPLNRKKTTLSALYVLTGLPEYREMMSDSSHEYKKLIARQEKSDTQRESWITMQEVTKTFKELEQKALNIYRRKTPLSPTDYQQIQNYIIVALTSGIFCEPRRALDYVFPFKIRNIDKEVDNYLDDFGKKPKLVFNKYKTAKTHGRQELVIPKILRNMLVKWIRKNPTDYLLFDMNFQSLSAVKLNQRLVKIFKKNVGVTQLRMTYLTHKYGHTIELEKDIKETMENMGSSTNMLKTYVKKE